MIIILPKSPLIRYATLPNMYGQLLSRDVLVSFAVNGKIWFELKLFDFYESRCVLVVSGLKMARNEMKKVY